MKKKLVFLALISISVGLLSGCFGHKHTYKFVAETTPTCTEAGTIAHYECEGCNLVFDQNKKPVNADSLKIAALGHKWSEPTYEWSNDYSICTATRVCQNDSSHVETEAANSSFEQLTAPTITTDGEGRYTAIFNNSGFTTQSVTVAIHSSGSLDALTFTLNYDNISYCVRAASNSIEGEVVIPSTYNGFPVTEIDDYAFRSSSLTSVIVPSSIVSIGHNAFYYLIQIKYYGTLESWLSLEGKLNLTNYIHLYLDGNDQETTSIVIPDSVTTLSRYAFRGCRYLQSMTMTNSVICLESGALSYLYLQLYYYGTLESWLSLEGKGELPNYVHLYLDGNDQETTNIVIPNTVTTINDYEFYNCYYITSITIPDGVTLIDWFAFYNCASLVSVSFPNGLKEIGNYAFEKCRSLSSIDLPDTILSIGDHAFQDTSIESRSYENAYYLGSGTNPYFILKSAHGDFETFAIHENCKIIMSTAFSNNTSLTSIVIPEGVRSIDYEAFYNCTSLVSVTLRNTATFLGRQSFGNCTSLENISIPSSVSSLTSAFYGCSALTSIVIPNGVSTIGSFFKCTSLSSIVIPSSVTTITERAFEQCSSLVSVTIPENVTRIETMCFDGCSSLKTVSLPESIVSIESFAFYKCTSLESINIPQSVVSIGESAFRYCSSLESVDVPHNVTSLGQYTFDECSSLNFNSYNNANYLGDSTNPYLVLVKSVDGNITSCNINNDCRFILANAFEYCLSLTSVVIPEGITTIPEWCFFHCYQLQTLSIPNSITKVGFSAFQDAGTAALNAYENAYYAGNDSNPYLILIKPINKTIESCEINNRCRIIYPEAFTGCKSLQSIYVPNNIENLSYGSFVGCSSLVSVTIGSGVSAIEQYTFSNCTSLTTVTLAGTITNIKSGAFENCLLLQTINFAGTIQQWNQVTLDYNWISSQISKLLVLCSNGYLFIKQFSN